MVFNVTFNNISVVAVICNEQECLICIFILLHVYILKKLNHLQEIILCQYWIKSWLRISYLFLTFI